jgi:hypothetical protein
MEMTDRMSASHHGGKPSNWSPAIKDIATSIRGESLDMPIMWNPLIGVSHVHGMK